MENYNEALTVLRGKQKNKQSRKIANNTYLIKGDGKISVRLHSTDIITFWHTGNIVLNSGGWKTVTTKARINEFSPFSIYQENSIWYVSFTHHEPKTYCFKDNMVISTQTGTVQGDTPLTEIKEKLKLKKQIKKYCDKMATYIKAGKLEQPSAGDCWGCLMKDKDGKTVFRNDHLLEHLKENYFVPSLILNAMNEFDKNDFMLAVLFDKSQDWSRDYDMASDRAKRAVRRYFYRQLNFAA